MKNNNDDFFDDSFEILDESLIDFNTMRPKSESNNIKKNRKKPSIEETEVEEEATEQIKPAKKKKKTNTNRLIVNTTLVFTVLFVAMLVYFVRFEYYDADEVINNTYNKRQNILAQSVKRGEIHADNGEVLATTITNSDGSETRTYPYGRLFSHVVGYECNGKSGIELSNNFKLLTSNSSILEVVINDLTGKKDVGDNLSTTLNVSVQSAAASALEGNDGAIIAIEPTTGKIIAMVSKPDFDPNSVEGDWDYIVNDEGNTSLLNRATNGLYPPGSTFKLFTLLEYIHEHPADYVNYNFNCEGSLTRGDSTIQCYNGNVHGNETLMDSFAYSCNSSFSNIGLTLNMDKFNKLCKNMLFDSSFSLNMSYKKSKFELNSSSSTFEIMQTVIGQGKTQITPLHLAMVASAIANEGTLMKPYLVDHVENYKGKVVKEYYPQKYKELLSKDDAHKLSEFMGAVVSYGTGTRLQSDYYTAYGKTGTAQFDSSDNSHSLFMGYADNGSKKLAICVVMEDMQAGPTWAVPAAKTVFDSYYK